MIIDEQNCLGDLANYIYDFCGINYKKNLNSLKTKLEARIKELGLTIWEYFGYVRMEPKEWDILIELITVNETYFFREENLLEEFKNAILPQYINFADKNPLRIWSAACSTGEEPYTIGMLIEDSGLFKDNTVQIIATDINKKVLEKAKSGLYKKNSLSFRRTPKDVYDKFFVDYGEYYKVKDKIVDMVEFRRINLLDNDLEKKIGMCDIIFCRNVFIYFDENAIQKIVNDFYKILNPGGYLLLGHAETITGIHNGFEVIHKPSVFYYKRKG
ncbi:CheR family methyltransferase [Thermoanaerobacterium thermosaccharolyticum]|uniref:CheR family methyltransferase n=1 Tax=Thermoanaerobacterium thermosaccharolyticum TaxID=1517 RepID=UPI0020A46E4D|nr:protein-glutamate O-methyltransferase CheR [Thermoanaerobacterium thermosaccharolyticum]MCP2241098.1 chemotaxis protein methyltransferase CheR [Thermoanaerobacterium thermosaccharolyticum]